MGLSVFGDSPAGLSAFTDSRGEGSDFRLVEHIGEPAIFTIRGPKEVQTADYGVKTAIDCDVVLLKNDKGEGEAFDNVLIFNAAPVDQMKRLAGQIVAAKIGFYEISKGRNKGDKAPRLEEPTPEIVRAAEAYLAKNS